MLVRLNHDVSITMNGDARFQTYDGSISYVLILEQGTFGEYVSDVGSWVNVKFTLSKGISIVLPVPSMEISYVDEFEQKI